MSDGAGNEKTFTLTPQQFEKLMNGLEINFVASLEGTKDEEGGRHGQITRDGYEVAQLKARYSAFNAEKVEEIILKTDLPTIIEALKEIGVRPQGAKKKGNEARRGKI